MPINCGTEAGSRKKAIPKEVTDWDGGGFI
jgi:hypothetical protein